MFYVFLFQDIYFNNYKIMQQIEPVEFILRSTHLKILQHVFVLPYRCAKGFFGQRCENQGGLEIC